MSKFKRYKLNPETLLYEIEKVSAKSRVLKTVVLVAASMALSLVYLWLFTSVLGFQMDIQHGTYEQAARYVRSYTSGTQYT